MHILLWVMLGYTQLMQLPPPDVGPLIYLPFDVLVVIWLLNMRTTFPLLAYCIELKAMMPDMRAKYRTQHRLLVKKG